jgi:superfamily I DNA and/or RNA helicase
MQKIISFYSKVFEQEITKSKQKHLYSSSIKKRYFIPKIEELTTTDYPLFPIPEAKALSFIKDIQLNNKQLELKYFTLFRLTKFSAFNTYEVKRAYPLFEYDAKIINKNEEYFIELDLLSRKSLNYNLDSKTKALIDYDTLFKNPFIDFDFVSKFATYLEKDKNLDSEELRLFPTLWSERKVKQKLNKIKNNENVFIPCSSLCLVEKQKYSFSTLEELKKIETYNSFSILLNTVFERNKKNTIEKTGVICEDLNNWQKIALENSNSKILSVISGPPGTGKSFTIANIAVEKISKQQSVIITAKNEEALEVIEEKINHQLNVNNITVLPSKDNNLNELKNDLKFILSRGYKRKNYLKNDIEKDLKQINLNNKQVQLATKELEDTFELEKTILKTINTNKFTKKTSEHFKKRIIKARGLKTLPLWLNLQKYYKKSKEKREFAIKTIEKLATYTKERKLIYDREHLKNYLKFLRARNLNRKNELLRVLNYKTILGTYPIWLVKTSDIARVFPLKKEMFDCLIIDEASQCDTPSIIPLLERSKKCIVVGDLNQLGHVSFLSKDVENKLKNNIPSYDQHLCAHRDYSFLKLVYDNIDPQNIAYLSEHFRSKHGIIQFSNKEFYNNELNILTKRPLNDSNDVEFIKCNGLENKSINQEEIKSIIEHIKQIIKNDKESPNLNKPTIGVLSPFRNQVDKLFSAIKNEFTINQIKAHKILVGTAFSFQGNERDIMMLSFVVDDNSHTGSLNYINRKDVFNVSVTRARYKQLVFYSFNPINLKSDSILEHYFNFYKKYKKEYFVETENNHYCDEIEQFVSKFGYDTWQNFEVSGVKIDILAQKNNQYIAIDLIGFPGKIGDFYPLERYKMLERGNIKLFPLPYAYWLYDKAFCLKAIEQLCILE